MRTDIANGRPRRSRWSGRGPCPDAVCSWHTQLRLIAIVKSEEVIKKILVAMHLPAQAPELHSARPPPGHREQGPGPSGEDRAS
jgi:hypothetical protein